MFQMIEIFKGETKEGCFGEGGCYKSYVFILENLETNIKSKTQVTSDLVHSNI